MKHCILPLLVLAASHTASAQLGEPEDKVVVRFGKPFRTIKADSAGITVTSHRSKTHQVTIGVKDGKAVYVIYRKLDGSSMTDPEIEAILSTQPQELGRWHRNIITGERRATVGQQPTLKSPFRDLQRGPREWSVLGKDELHASFYFEKNVLVLWNSKTGPDAQAILQQHRL